MAYDPAYLGNFGYAGSKGAMHFFVLDTVDDPAEVMATDYITDAVDRGMAVGDPILIRQYDDLETKANYIGSILASVDAIDADGNGTLVGTGIDVGGTVAVTATDDGLTTGIIPAGSRVVQVTSANAAHLVTLPAPTVGRELLLINTSGVAFELQSSAPTTISINGGAGASASSTLALTALLIRCVCISATQWIANSHVAAGTESAVEAAS